MIIPGMTERYIDFIGFYENVYPQGLCHHIVENFEKFIDNGYCGTRKTSENARNYIKSDTFMFMNINNHHGNSFQNFHGENVKNLIQGGLQR